VIPPGVLDYMRNVASAAWREQGPYVEQHAGDIAWGANPSRGRERVLGYLFEDAYAFADDTEWHLGGTDFGEAVEAAAEAGATVLALEAEGPKNDALRHRGYVPATDSWYWHYARDLADLPPMPVAPDDGWTDEERVGVHRAAWAGSAFDSETYDLVRATPPYRRDLDVVVRAEDGTPAAYALAWLDEGSGFGELEPVGTAAEYRRRGYGAAACLAALHGLRDAGAHTAVVYSVSDPANQGPSALYESIGFRRIDRHVRWLPPFRQNAPGGGNA
jgi:ribosomal protein S18 acetylase RimI-like enzyme